MTDKHKPQATVENLDSGVLKVTIPADKLGSTDVDVQPGTSVHQVLVDSRETKPMSDERGEAAPPVERRQPQAPVHLQVDNRPTTPGLPGWNGIVAQWGAFGFVLLLCFAMWTTIKEVMADNKALFREELKLLKDEMRASRDQDDKRDLAFVAALDRLHAKFDTSHTTMGLVAAEFRATKAALELKLNQILAALKVKAEEMARQS